MVMDGKRDKGIGGPEYHVHVYHCGELHSMCQCDRLTGQQSPVLQGRHGKRSIKLALV